MDDSRFSDPGNGMQRAGEIAAALKQAAPLLIRTLHDQWHTEQGTRIRQVLWSLYTSSHLVNLGKACTGLERPLADALLAAIGAHLILGPEAEPVFDSILRESGEIARFEEVERATPEHLPVIYPDFPLGLPALCQIAAAMDHLEGLDNNLPG